MTGGKIFPGKCQSYCDIVCNCVQWLLQVDRWMQVTPDEHIFWDDVHAAFRRYTRLLIRSKYQNGR